MPHSLEISFTEQGRHGRRGNGIAFESEERVIATLVPATVICVMLIVVMKEAGLAAGWTRRILTRPPSFPLSLSRYARSVGGKLMPAIFALILLIPIGGFSKAVKVLIVVALRTSEMVYFRQENLSPFWEVLGFVTKLLYH